MYLRKIKNKWQCQIQVNEVRQSKIFLSKKSAGRWGIDTIKKIHQGVNLEKVNTPLHEAINLYIKQFTKHKKSAVREKLMWERLMRDYPKLCGMKLSEIKPQHILDFKTHKSKDGKRITNYYLCLLNNLFKKCINIWLYPLPINPVANIEHFKIAKGRYRPIERHEYKILLSHQCKYFVLAILILRNTGIRLSELHNLTHNDLDTLRNKLIIRVAKNNKLRTIPVNTWLIKRIENTRSNNLIIPFTYNAMVLKFKRVLKKFDNPTLQIHDFRRHYTSKLVESKMNLFDVASRTGHQSISMIQHYYGFGLR